MYILQLLLSTKVAVVVVGAGAGDDVDGSVVVVLDGGSAS